MKRLSGWERRYSDFLISSKDLSFSWGDNDCLRFSGKAIEVITGENPFIIFEEYKTEEQCKNKLIDVGGLRNLIESCMGKSHGRYLMAKRGDLVTVRNGDQIICGLVSDCGQKVIALSEYGLIRLPMNSINRIWSY